jgi:hypothetical protein
MKSITLLLAMALMPFLNFAQTHSLLKNIGTGSESGIPDHNQATNWKSKSYFITLSPSGIGNRLWSTDGTTAHTAQVLTADYPEMEFLTSIDNVLIFNAWKDTYRGIYKSNGTPASTTLLAQFPSRHISFMKNLDNHTVIFVTENFNADSTFLWSTNGTSAGTILLGQFEIKSGFIETSYYKNNLILTEKSSNFDLFPPIITDGTVAGTKLVTDFINEMVTPDITTAQSAVGTTDFIFVQTASGGKVFDGSTVSNFALTDDYNYGFKLGHLNVVFSSYEIMAYDSMDKTSKLLPVDLYYFTEPISHNGKVYFHNTDKYVYESDGTMAGTKKIGSQATGALNYDPYLFATDQFLLYSADRGNNTEFWSIDLNTDVDTLFSVIKPASNANFVPNAFLSGNHLVYARSTSAEGNEYWVYDPMTSGTKDLTSTHSITISPNPADLEVRITFDDVIPAYTNLSIYNVSGQIVLRSHIEADQLKLYISQFIPGQYYLQLESSNGIQYGGSFIKK